MNHATDWHYCMSVHSDLWKLEPPLTQGQVVAYAYINSFCHKPFAISMTIMAKKLSMDSKRLKRHVDSLEDRNLIKRGPFTKGHPRTFMVIPRRSKTWGQTPPPIGSNAPTHLGSNAPTGWGQTPRLTDALMDTFLSLFHTHFAKWTFNRMPIGRHFIFTRGMQTKAIECMRSLHNKMGWSSKEQFDTFLNGCGEYLSHDRDVLSPSRDQRALSPGKWLNDWPEQTRLAGIYLDDKDRKITRMDIEQP